MNTMIYLLTGLPESRGKLASESDAKRAASRRRTAKWISGIGWFFTGGGVVCLLTGLSDLQNLIFVVALGIVFIPLGLVIVANGQILAGLATIEQNMRTQKMPARGDSSDHCES